MEVRTKPTLSKNWGDECRGKNENNNESRIGMKMEAIMKKKWNEIESKKIKPNQEQKLKKKSNKSIESEKINHNRS